MCLSMIIALGVTNILEIALSYVEPLYLREFFLLHHLDKTIKFTYDASHYDLTDDVIWNVYKLFPSIVLVGVRVGLNVTDKYFIKKIAPKLMYVHLSDTHLSICAELMKCTNLRSITSFESSDMIMSLFKLSKQKLCTISIPCTNMIRFNTISNCINLRKIKVAGIRQINNEKMSCNVQIIKMINAHCMETLSVLKCPNLRIVRLLKCKILSDISTLEEFHSLRIIQLVGAKRIGGCISVIKML